LLILGQSGTQGFVEILLLSAGGEWYGMKEYAMFNLIGLLTRAFPQAGAGFIRASGWLLYGLAVIVLSVLWYRKRSEEGPPIGVSVIVVLLAVPHLHFHDLALLLLPLYEITERNHRNKNIRASIATTLPVAISLLLLLSNVSPLLQYTTPYLIMFALAIYSVATIPHRS
jgi:hypothetical protein